MGRNWRTCVNLPFVAIRQLFLDGEEEILKNDFLLDSFYQAQNEVLDWMRIITVSAGLGCSLWWGYPRSSVIYAICKSTCHVTSNLDAYEPFELPVAGLRTVVKLNAY
jgi:hypothetical protein